MDIKRNNDYRYGIYEDMLQYNNVGNNKYNYAKYGIIQKCLPKILFRPNGNIVLTTFLQLIDLRIITLIKYVEKLQKFKWIANY